MNKDKVLSIRIKPHQHELLEKKALMQDKRVSGYVRKLIKTDLDPNVSGVDSSDPELERKFESLQKDYEKIKKERDSLLKEKKELEMTIENLSSFKDNVFEQLLFLMSFFQKNAKLLQQHDKDYIIQNREKFAMIAKQLEGGK